MMKMTVSAQSFVHTVERNFNGVSLNDLGWCIPQVIQDALLSSNNASILSNRMHFKLIIDCTNDDSILHLLNSGEVVNNSKRSMFKLSHLPQDVILEELRLIVGMKFAALQGNLAMLSQMESINESFYNLFNQCFQAVSGYNGTVSLYANIAVGGISQRSLIKPEFECVIHMKE